MTKNMFLFHFHQNAFLYNCSLQQRSFFEGSCRFVGMGSLYLESSTYRRVSWCKKESLMVSFRWREQVWISAGNPKSDCGSHFCWRIFLASDRRQSCQGHVANNNPGIVLDVFWLFGRRLMHCKLTRSFRMSNGCCWRRFKVRQTTRRHNSKDISNQLRSFRRAIGAHLKIH